MIEAMNLFQSLLMYTSLVPGGSSKPEVKLSITLKREAETLLAIAEEEWQNAIKSQELIKQAELSQNQKLRKNFLAIAVWHVEHAAAKYLEASRKFTEASEIQTRNSKSLAAAASRSIERYERARNAAEFFKSLEA